MTPVELEVSSHRVTNYDPKTNKDIVMESLDMVNEKQEEAYPRAAAQRQRVV